MSFMNNLPVLAQVPAYPYQGQWGGYAQQPGIGSIIQAPGTGPGQSGNFPTVQVPQNTAPGGMVQLQNPGVFAPSGLQAPGLLSNIPTGPGVVVEPYVPVDQPQRLGPTQFLHSIQYDTPLACVGIAQVLGNPDNMFNNPTRCAQEQLCSVRQAGQMTDGKTLATHGLGFLCNFTATPALYELAVYFAFVVVMYQDAKKSTFWNDQMGAGGGVFGYNNNTSAFTITNGNPNGGGFLSLAYPLQISLYRSFSFVLRWMTNIPGLAVDPLTTLNADAVARKLIRFYLHSVEGRDPSNG